MTKSLSTVMLMATAMTALAVGAALAQAADVAPVVVVSATPLPGAAGNSDAQQTATAADIAASHAVDLTAFMNRTLAGVYINDIQNNPLQPDLNYRGYTASPLLGTPQGLSVYVDGVRANQPFGDVVSWDLIPRAAIANLALIGGSNPLFGLNTLGGAVAIRTKDGFTAPGAAVQLGYGSYQRRTAEFELGASAANGLHGYITANSFRDDGWRDDSPSKADQIFAKGGWRGEATDIGLSLAFADTDLTGNGLQEQRFLARDRSSVYTKPDNTQNRSGAANLMLEHRFSDVLSLSGNAYYRKIKTRTFNGDINEESLTENIYQPSVAERAALTAAGITGFPTAGETAANTPFPSYRCIANALLNSEPGEKCNGLINRTATVQDEKGASAQLTYKHGMSGALTVGGAYSESDAHFVQSTQFGYLTRDRGVVGVAGPGAFADGTQDSENAFDARVNLRGRTRTASLYATDTLALTPALDVTLSGRYDSIVIRNRDAYLPNGGPGSLTGDHRFSNFNPAVAATYAITPAISAYAGFTQGGRAPSAIELGCADPDNPCRLPNAMAGDPPLKRVTTRTLDGGLRGARGGFKWSVGLFRAQNRNDILFVADDQAGFGYFRNFGKTRRQGVEAAANGKTGRFTWRGSYTYLDATFRSAERVNGAGNSSNDIGPGFEGTIAIAGGDRIPLIPAHVFKAGGAYDLGSKVTLSADMIALSGVYARGNENNQHRGDGTYYLGAGKTDGYAVWNFGVEYRPLDGLKLFAQLNNAFDENYETAAQLAATGFTDTGAFIARPFAGPIVDGERPTRNATFYAPGAPRMIWVGLRYAFGGR